MRKNILVLLLVPLISFTVTAQTYRATVAGGNWNNPAIWQGGVLPATTETPVITAGHTVVYNVSSGTFAGIVVNGHLSLTDTGNHVLQSTQNIVIHGQLNMAVSGWDKYQLIRFTGINENNYAGGGDTVQASDIGLWVVDTGRLNLDGRPTPGSGKTPYVNASGGITTGQSTISLNQTPANWKSGDDVAIAPTQSPSVGDDYILGFDNASLTANVTSSSVSLNATTAYPHPQVNSSWTAEVFNLTRPLRIEGTATGRAHIFIKSSKPQFISHVAFRYLGPRKDINADGFKELVMGRYGLHIHHCMDGSRGSVVENCVMRDVDNHCFVPHMSHGIAFKKNIAYNCTETPFWWDRSEATHDILWDSNLVAYAKFVPHALQLPFEDEEPGFSASCFELGMGDGNIATNNIAIASTGDSHAGGAFNWEANNEGVWTFKNNLAHNAVAGIRVWQNTTKNHVIENFIAYYNGEAIFHGAYANSYRYIGGSLYGNPVIAKAASSHSSRVRFENMTINAAGLPYAFIMVESPLSSATPMLIRNCSITGYSTAALVDQCTGEKHSADIIQSTGTFTVDAAASDSEVIRIQPTSGQSTKVTTAGTTNISNFAPTIWGDGTGLKGDYYNNTDFTSFAFTRTDSYIGFSEWSSGVHYAIDDETYSVRWTGQIQPQYTEKYLFSLGSGGGHRLWVNNVLLIDSWEDHYPDDFSGDSILLTAGEKYDITLEYFNEDERTGINLYWNSQTLNHFSPGGEYVPQSQLWPASGSRKSTGVIAQNPSNLVSGEFIIPTIVKNNILVKSPKETAYTIYDLTGRMMMKGKIIKGYNYIPAGSMAQGMLLLKVQNGPSVKIIKQ
jgi:hypothetical protein